MIRKIASLIVVLLLTINLFAGGTQEGSDEPLFPDEIVALSSIPIQKIDGAVDMAMMIDSIEFSFIERGIELELNAFAGQGFYDKFLVYIAAGMPTDIYFVDELMLEKVYSDIEKYFGDIFIEFNSGLEAPYKYAYPMEDEEGFIFYALFLDEFGDMDVLSEQLLEAWGSDVIMTASTQTASAPKEEVITESKPVTEPPPEVQPVQNQPLPELEKKPDPAETARISAREAQEKLDARVSILNADTILTVLDIVAGEGFSDAEALMITDLISESVHKTSSSTVIDRRQRVLLLQEVAFSLSGCSDESCQLEAGKLLSADTIVVGSLGQFGSAYVINLKLLEVETGKTLGSASHIMEKKEDVLMLVDEIVDTLVKS